MKATMPYFVLLVAAGLTALTGFASQTAPLEPLHAIGFERDGVNIDVRSQGCTKADHFILRWAERDDGSHQLSVLRTVPDRCRAKPRRVTLRLAADLAGKETIYVENQFNGTGF